MATENGARGAIAYLNLTLMNVAVGTDNYGKCNTYVLVHAVVVIAAGVASELFLLVFWLYMKRTGVR